MSGGNQGVFLVNHQLPFAAAWQLTPSRSPSGWGLFLMGIPVSNVR